MNTENTSAVIPKPTPEDIIEVMTRIRYEYVSKRMSAARKKLDEVYEELDKKFLEDVRKQFVASIKRVVIEKKNLIVEKDSVRIHDIHLPMSKSFISEMKKSEAKRNKALDEFSKTASECMPEDKEKIREAIKNKLGVSSSKGIDIINSSPEMIKKLNMVLDKIIPEHKESK